MNTPDLTPDAPFDAPWQAQVFGLTVALNEQAVFTWTEWAATFSTILKPMQNAPGGDEPVVYWQAWAKALEALLTSKNIASPDAVSTLATRWQEAAHATPHGVPIRLENAPH